MANPSGLRAMFEPAAVAVVGASAAPDKAGHQMLRSLLGFPGTLYAIHPDADRILDVPAYPSLQQAPEPVDLAVLTVPPPVVPHVLRDGGEAGLQAAVICAGGFAEAGEQGASLQEEVRAIAADAGIRLLGPNTSGFVNPPAGVHAVFVPAVAELGAGGLAVVAQSGGVNLATCFLAHAAGTGIRIGVGLGNSVDVGFADVLAYLGDDEQTSVVALHVEGVPDGRALHEAVRETTARKPVVALVVGRADVGDFARSHTGAMTADWDVTRAALRQAGAVVVEDTTELVDAARALAAGRARPAADPGIGVVTGQAGPGLLIADRLHSSGVAVPELAPHTVERIGELLPPLTYQRNPVDTGRPSPNFSDVLAAVADDPGIGALLVYALHEPGAVDITTAVEQGLTGRDVPVLHATGGLPAEVGAVQDALARLGVPTFDAPERGADAIRAIAEDARARHRIQAPDRRSSATVVALPETLDEEGAKQLLEQIGIPVSARRVCTHRQEAEEALDALGPPVVVKVLDPDITHKTDVDGVHVDVRDRAALRAAIGAIDAIPGGSPSRRYLVEKMADAGPELIVGAVRNPSFGPVVLLGVGGVVVEALELRVLRLAPLTTADGYEMIHELPGRRLIEGFRGQPAADPDVLADVICRVGDLVVQHPSIETFEINPLRVTAHGLVALDALLVVDEGH